MDHQLVGDLFRERRIEPASDVDCHEFLVLALVVCFVFRALKFRKLKVVQLKCDLLLLLRLFCNNQFGDLVVSRLWNDFFLYEVRFRPIRTPINDLLRVRWTDARQGLQLVFGSAIQINKISRCS